MKLGPVFAIPVIIKNFQNKEMFLTVDTNEEL
jgi:hypothetical protein